MRQCATSNAKQESSARSSLPPRSTQSISPLLLICCQPAHHVRRRTCSDMEGRENVFLEILESAAVEGEENTSRWDVDDPVPALLQIALIWNVKKETDMHCTLGDKLTILKGKRLRQRTLSTTKKKNRKRTKNVLQSLIWLRRGKVFEINSKSIYKEVLFF